MIRASSGGEYHGGVPAREEPVDVGLLRAGAAQRVDRDAEDGAADREPRPIQSAMPVPASVRSPPTVAAKWAKIGAIMNAATARKSSMIANTRCRLRARSEKPATNSAGATVAPSPIPVRNEPSRVSAWLEGTSIRKTAIPAARNAMPTSGR